MAVTINLRESHFFGLPTQSNVYCLSKLCGDSTSVNKLLVATLKRQIFTLEYSKHFGLLIPSSKEVHFTYIPNDADIISIDAFNKSGQSNDFVVGITFIKKAENHENNQYFNIYFDWEPGSEFNLDTIAQCGTSLQLPFTPYQLYHTRIKDGENEEVVWLLSGSDCQIHLYRENTTLHKYMEQPISELFPELEKLPSIALTIDIVHFEALDTRFTVIGCEGAEILLFYVDAKKKEVISTWNTCHDGAISSVCLFATESVVPIPDILLSSEGPLQKEGYSVQPTEYNVLVTSTLEQAVVYRNIKIKGFQDQHALPDSDRYDCTLCSCVADLDMDGYNEIVLGTYGQELLVYKYNPGVVAPSRPSRLVKHEGRYDLVWQRSFANPIQSICYMDITGDGLNELVLLSLKGLHILQHSLPEVAELCEERLAEMLLKLQSKKEVDSSSS